MRIASRPHLLAHAGITCGILCGVAGFAITLFVATGARVEGPLPIALVVIGALAWLAMVAFLSLYVYADAESRGMPGAIWAILIFFVASLPGFIIYLLIRSPRLRNCPHCATALRPDYVLCPGCGLKVGLGCPECHRHVEPGWTVCPHCQNSLVPVSA